MKPAESIDLDEYLGIVDAPASAPPDFLDAALRVAARGFRVFPITPGDKKPPLISEWQLRASSDPEQIREWGKKWPTANIGLVADDLLIVDVDPRNGGDKGLEGLEALYGALPSTGPAVRTGGGGVHIYFRSPGGLSSSTSRVATGVDIKTGLGYVVIPPSVTTAPYKWIRDLEQELPEVPGWLLEKLTRKNTKPFTVPDAVTEGNRNDILFRLARALKTKGLPAVAIGAALLTANQDFKPPLPVAEVEQIIANALRQPDRPDFTPPAPASPSGSAEKPTILLNGDLTDMTEQGWAAIVQANTGPSLFQRSTVATRLERDDDGFLMTKELTEKRLRREAARASTFYAVGEDDDGKKTLKEVYPPMPIVQNMLAVEQLPLPVLDRIVEVPTFTASGKLRTVPGYDLDGRTFYMPPVDLKIAKVPPRPTQQEIQTAGQLIKEVFQEFSVVGQADTAHAIGLMLQPFMRDLIRGPVPNHIFDAPAPGTGKTLMARAALLPALGRQVVAMGNCRDEEEWRKRIGAKLMAAAPVVFMDNIKTGSPFDSAALASAITSYPKWEDRRLGVSEMPQMPVRAPWVTTGNNISLSMELARRSVRTRLVAPDDRPWLRTDWTHDPLEDWILAERPRIIHACLTLGAAWLAAGRPAPPKGTPTLGMFESWVRVIGGTLMVAGISGFLENIEDLYAEADQEGGEQREFFIEWQKKFQDLMTYELANLEAGLPTVVVEALDRKAKLAYYLRGIKDKKVRLEKGGPTYVAVSSRNRNNITQWYLKEA
jgi:hypothetical protein